MAFKFENLRVWQDAVELSNTINQIVMTFPKHEMYVLSSQIQRATDSISLNIAEGSTGQTNPEFKRFLGYAIRSGIEVIGCLHLAKGRKLISSEQFVTLYEQTEKLIKSTQALRKTLDS